MRGDLSAGEQAAQVAHVAFEFTIENPSLVRQWHQDSNYLVIVAVADGHAIHELAVKADDFNLAYWVMQEPDMNDEATAIALEPGQVARKLCASLPLALREPAVT